MISNEQIKKEAAELIRSERDEWDMATVFVTEKVAFNMRPLIRRLRKNYWGVFDEQQDPTTGRKKTWIPLTESLVDTFIKNVDIDTKDMNFRAKKQESIGLSGPVRAVAKDRLDRMNFGEKIDQFIQTLGEDGTAIWRTFETKFKGKSYPNVREVDLLNFYIDPSADNIATAFSVIERHVMTPDEFMSFGETEGLDHLDDARIENQVSKVDRMNATTQQKGSFVVVHERWGKMPKYFMTGEDSDMDSKEMVEGRIIMSGLDSQPVVHLIEENKRVDNMGLPIRPYEEAWAQKIKNRWYGRGPAEKVMFIQTWLNLIVNIRINRAMVSQLGIFKIRKGSNITPQMMSRLAANGAIVVNDMKDIEQMAMREASQASYTDEQNAVSWADRVTSSFEAITGETLPASVSATNAVLQQRAAMSYFTRVRENLGFFLQRWWERQAMPIIQKSIRPEDIIRITGELDEVKAFDDRIVRELVYRKVEEMVNDGKIIDPESVTRELQSLRKKFSKMGKDRYVKLMDKIDLSEFDIQVYVTNEEIDKAVVIKNLLAILQTIPNIPNSGIDPTAIILQMADLMGLNTNQLKQGDLETLQQQVQQEAQQLAQGGQQPQGQQPQSPPQNLEVGATEVREDLRPQTPFETRIAQEANTL